MSACSGKKGFPVPLRLNLFRMAKPLVAGCGS
jgi:hypothetical protein